MKAFIDEHRNDYGVEPMSRVLPIAPSTYFAHAAKKAHPDLRSERVKRDESLSRDIQRVFDENFRVYGEAQGLASVEAGRLHRREMHGRAPDESHGTERGHAW